MAKAIAPFTLPNDIASPHPEVIKQAGIRRNARKAAAEAVAAAPTEYPPGYFTELMARHDWPPLFSSQLSRVDWRAGPSASMRASATRERAFANGEGWGSGTILLPGTPKMPKPEWERKKS